VVTVIRLSNPTGSPKTKRAPWTPFVAAFHDALNGLTPCATTQTWPVISFRVNRRFGEDYLPPQRGRIESTRQPTIRDAGPPPLIPS
jgi:hypothetical protein